MTLISKKTPTKAASKQIAKLDKPTPASQIKVNAIRRHNRIAKAAYYLAEKNNFKGNSDEHWLQAEASIDKKLSLK